MCINGVTKICRNKIFDTCRSTHICYHRIVAFSPLLKIFVILNKYWVMILFDVKLSKFNKNVHSAEIWSNISRCSLCCVIRCCCVDSYTWILILVWWIQLTNRVSGCQISIIIKYNKCLSLHNKQAITTKEYASLSFSNISIQNFNSTL